MTVQSGFNPYAESSSSSTGEAATKVVGSRVSDRDKYDPNYVQSLIQQEKKNKKLIMKRDKPDRDTEVFASTGGSMDRE